MMLIREILRRASIRRLRLRARQIADLIANPLATVYPQQLHLEEGKSRRVLVLTPHADDESFGAGGALCRHVAAGDDVRILLFSDNVASIDGKDMSYSEKLELREHEFVNAMHILGVADFHCFRLSDRAFSAKKECPEGLMNKMIEFQPDVLYLPSLFDNHHDHRILNIWLLRTLTSVRSYRPIIRGFEVWSPLPATAVMDISAETEKKQRMMRSYSSQLHVIDYEHHVLGLNAYRAMTVDNASRYAEAFLELPSDAYLAFGTSLFHI